MLIKRVENFLEMCRLCLNNGPTLKSLFHLNEDATNKNDLVDKISKCLNIKIKEGDRFSKKICGTCVNDVNRFYAFWTNSYQAQKLLIQFSNNLEKAINEDEPLENVNEKTFSNVKKEPAEIQENCVVNNTYIEEVEESTSDELEIPYSNDVDPLAVTDQPSVINESLTVKTNPRIINNQSIIAQNTIKEISSTQSQTMFLLIKSVNKNQCTNESETVISTSHNSNNNHNRLQNLTIVKNSTNQPSTSLDSINMNNPRDNSNLITCVLKDKNSVETTYTVNIRTLNSTAETTQEIKENKCEFCGKCFPHKCRLDAHRRRHTGEKPFLCDIDGCNKRFSSKTGAEMHKKCSHSNERPYTCKICLKTFKRKTGFNIHLKTHSEQKDYHCDLCNYSTFTLFMLNQHKKTHIHLYKYICECCGKGFLYENDFIKHGLIHNRIYTCNKCGEKFRDLLKLKEHRKRLHKRVFNIVNCPICGKEISSKQVNIHIKRDHMGMRYQCYCCSLQVTSRSSLIHHLRKHTGEKPYKCFTCKKRFTAGRILKLHQIVHSKERRYVCKVCNKRYSQKSSLNAHTKKVHVPYDNISPFKCEKCGIITNNKLSHQMHKNNVHNKHKYKCFECGIKVKNKSLIIIHLRKHNGNKPYECNDCKQCFISRNELKLHQFQHVELMKTELVSNNAVAKHHFDYDGIGVKEEIICEPTLVKEESRI